MTPDQLRALADELTEHADALDEIRRVLGAADAHDSPAADLRTAAAYLRECADAAPPSKCKYGTDTMSEMGIIPMCDEPQPERQPVSVPTEAQHPDDAAVDRFGAAMKAKLAEKRAEGRGGWDDPEQCSTTYLAMLLRGHVEKGDPLDVGNFAMMLWNRGGATNEAIDAGIPDLRPTEAQIEAAAEVIRRGFDRPGESYGKFAREIAPEVLRAALAAKESK